MKNKKFKPHFDNTRKQVESAEVRTEKPVEVKIESPEKLVEVIDEKVKIPHPKKIEVGYSKVHNRGVFATDEIEEGELVERCPMVALGFRTNYHKDPQLFNYLYTHHCPCEDCEKHGSVFLMVLGYGMVYNHQDFPNTKWVFNHEKLYADLIATKKIKKEEEIFAWYGLNYFSNKRKVVAEGYEEAVIPKALDIKMPKEWQSWVYENVKIGVNPAELRETLTKNNFEKEEIEMVLEKNISQIKNSESK